jgi:hypothetical protein
MEAQSAGLIGEASKVFQGIFFIFRRGIFNLDHTVFSADVLLKTRAVRED